MNSGEPLRLGVVGVNRDRGWARDAHIPAIATLPQFISLAAVSSRTQVDADAAAAHFGAALAFGNSLDLVRSPAVDAVAVTVKVPEHRAIVLAALEAGKHVYCEWPLGRNVGEAQEMAAAVAPGLHAAIGLQALSAPAVRAAAGLVRAGTLGRPRVIRCFSPTIGWGPDAPPFYAYLQDKRNGATLERVVGGHTFALLETLVGPLLDFDSINSIFLPEVEILGQAGRVPRTSADHMLTIGRHETGCVSTVEVAGGVRDKPFCLELQCDRGWLRLSSNFIGGFQAGNIILESSATDVAAAEPSALEGPPANLRESYLRFAEDIATGSSAIPDFRTAVRLTDLIERIERAAAKQDIPTGERK